MKNSSTVDFNSLQDFRQTLYKIDKRLWPCKSLIQCLNFTSEWGRDGK